MEVELALVFVKQVIDRGMMNDPPVWGMKVLIGTPWAWVPIYTIEWVYLFYGWNVFKNPIAEY